MATRTAASSGYAGSASGWDDSFEAIGAPDDSGASTATTGGAASDPLILDFSLSLPSWPTAAIQAGTTISITALCRVEHTGPGTFADGSVQATIKVRSGTVTASASTQRPLDPGFLAYTFEFTLADDFTGDSVTAEELETVQVELVASIVDTGDSFDPADTLGVAVDSVQVSITLVADPIAYAPDTRTKRIIPMALPADVSGVGGLSASFLADPVGSLESHFAGARNAGNYRTSLFWIAGRVPPPGMHIGCYADEYPGGGNGILSCEPMDEATCLALAAGDAADVQAAWAELYTYFASDPLHQRPLTYLGCRPAHSSPTDALLASVQQTVIDIDADVAFDANGPLDYQVGKACPLVYDLPHSAGSIVKGYFVPGSRMYSDDDGENIIVADAAVALWTSQVGSAEFAQTIALARPTYKTSVLNGSPVVRFGAASYMTAPAAIDLTSPFVFGVVCKPTSADAMIFSNSGANRQVRFNESGTGSLSLFDGTNSVLSSAGEFTASAWGHFRYEFDGSDASMYVNGNGTVGNTFAGFELDVLGCFAFPVPSNFFNSDVSEIYFAVDPGGVITQNHRDLVDHYFEDRYGITTTLTNPTLPHRALWDLLISTGTADVDDWAGKVWTEAIEVQGVESIDLWLEQAAANARAGGVMAITNRAMASFDPEDANTFNRFDLMEADPETWQNVTTMRAIDNGDGSTPRVAAIILNAGGVSNASVLAAIQHIFDNDLADDVIVDAAALDNSGWTSAMAIEDSANAGMSGSASDRVSRVDRVSRINRFGA